MTLRPILLAGALTLLTAGAAFAQTASQTTSPALTPSSGGQGDTATASKQQQDPTLGSGAAQPSTPTTARTSRHRRHGSTNAAGGASDSAPAGATSSTPTLPDSSPSSPTPGPGL